MSRISISLTKHLLIIILMSGFILSPLTTSAQTTSYSTYQPRTQVELLAYLYGVLAQLQAQLAEQRAAENTSSRNYTTTRNEPNPFFVNVFSLAPTSVARDTATLKAEVDKGGSAFLDVWFQYGEGTRLTKTHDVPQVTKTGRQTVIAALKDLDANTTYSYRVVAEDEDGNRHYGQTRTFTTVDTQRTLSFYGRPVAETEGVTNVRSNGADIQGFITMNDYEFGKAFFVYGSSRTNVTDADNYVSYNEIPVSSEIVNKRLVNSKFIGRNTVKSGISSLKPATRYYYRACVEYYKNNDVKSPSLSCGGIENFTTLN